MNILCVVQIAEFIRRQTSDLPMYIEKVSTFVESKDEYSYPTQLTKNIKAVSFSPQLQFKYIPNISESSDTSFSNETQVDIQKKKDLRLKYRNVSRLSYSSDEVAIPKTTAVTDNERRENNVLRTAHPHNSLISAPSDQSDLAYADEVEKLITETLSVSKTRPNITDENVPLREIISTSPSRNAIFSPDSTYRDPIVPGNPENDLSGTVDGKGTSSPSIKVK